MPEEEKTEEVKEEKDEFFSKEGDKESFESFDTEEKETPPESSTEEKTEKEESPSSQGEEVEADKEVDKAKAEDTETEKKLTPFHEHPRWQKLTAKLGQLETDNEVLRTQLASDRKKEEAGKSEPIPTWFSGLYGDNQEMWRGYQALQGAEREKIKAEIREERQTLQEQENAEVKKWDDWVDQEIIALKADGKKFDRNELLKVAIDYKPTDDSGNISFSGAYEILQAIKSKKSDSAKSQARKKLGDATTSDSKAEPSQKGYKTPEDLKGKGWDF